MDKINNNFEIMSNPLDRYMNRCIASKYKVSKGISFGTYGYLYEAKEIVSGLEYAIKIEPMKRQNSVLKEEYLVMKDIQSEGFPKVYEYGEDGDIRFIAMELLGPCLEELVQFTGGKFSLKTCLLIGDQILSRIEYLHNKLYVHRDIKPENFLISKSLKCKTLYMIDFGLAKRYKDPKTGKHHSYRDGRSLTGTIRYASINSHMGVELSRRDDIESFVYTLLYFMKGSLPWMGIKASKKREKIEKITSIKTTIASQKVCEGCPKEIASILDHVKRLKYDEKPSYNLIRKTLHDLVYSKTDGQNLVFDWSSNLNEYFLHKKINKRSDSPEILKHVFCGRKRELSEFLDCNTFRSMVSERQSLISASRSSRNLIPKFNNMQNIAINNIDEDEKETKEKEEHKKEIKIPFIREFKDELFMPKKLNIEIPEIPNEFEDNFQIILSSAIHSSKLKNLKTINSQSKNKKIVKNFTSHL